MYICCSWYRLAPGVDVKRDKLYKSTSVWNSNVGSGKEMDDATTTTITLVYSKIGTIRYGGVYVRNM